jgi:hypothetical protein
MFFRYWYEQNSFSYMHLIFEMQAICTIHVPWLTVWNFINCLNTIKLTPWNLGRGHRIRLWRKPRTNSTINNWINESNNLSYSGNTEADFPIATVVIIKFMCAISKTTFLQNFVFLDIKSKFRVTHDSCVHELFH